MDSTGFPNATLFDYLNPWSDLRIALDNVLPRMLKAMKQEIRVSLIPPPISICMKKKRPPEVTNCKLEDP